MSVDAIVARGSICDEVLCVVCLQSEDALLVWVVKGKDVVFATLSVSDLQPRLLRMTIDCLFRNLRFGELERLSMEK